VHTTQKRFQCEILSEKSAVLRERTEEIGSPVNEHVRSGVEGGSWFKSAGPINCIDSCLNHRSPGSWDLENCWCAAIVFRSEVGGVTSECMHACKE